MTALIKLEHSSPYSWFAQGKRKADRQLLPILRIRKGKNYHSLKGLFIESKEESEALGHPDWWRSTGAKMDEWRSALSSGRLVALRFHQEDGTTNGSTGLWLGVYEIISATLSEREIRVDLEPKRKWSILQ